MAELTFNIDKKQSAIDKALVIHIDAGPQTPLLYPNALRKLSSERDNAVIAWLIQEELTFLKRNGKSPNEAVTAFNLVRIAYSHTFEGLKLLSATGKLFCEGRRLVVDLFGRIDFNFLVEQNAENQINIFGRIKTEKQEFDIREADFICAGPPHWIIKGISLRFMNADISWSLLQKAFQSPTTLKIDEVQEELENEDVKCKIIYTGNTNEIVKQSRQALPVLMLRDRMGAFADLWMDYGDGKRIAFHDQNATKIKRDRSVERSWEKDLLETDFVHKVMVASQYYCPLNKVGKSLSFLLEVGWQIIDIKGNTVVSTTKTELKMEDNNQAILIKGKVKYGSFEADLKDVVGTFNRRERFVELGSGVVGLVPQQLEQIGLGGIEDGEIVAEGIAMRRNQIGSLKEMFDSGAIVAMDDKILALRENLKSFHGTSQTDPGSAFKGQLRTYQQAGLNWLAFLYEYGFHGILADDMGLGKTVQVLAFISQLKLTSPILIVLPTSLLFNWQREIEHFLPGFQVYRHHGPERQQKSLPLEGIILTSYTTLRMDLGLFAKTQFQCLILDEAQAIKNPHTQIAQAVFNLHARFRLSITGTPIENHLNELWSHFRFLMPDLLGNEKEFMGDIQASGADARFLQSIKKKIRPFMLRRTKDEVAKDLPEKIEQIVWVEMAPSQRKVYDDFLAGVQGNLFKKVNVDGVGKHRMEIFEAILRLRQICCHPLLVSSQLESDQKYDSSKLDSLMEDIETAVEEGRKALVYSQFTSMLSLIAKEVKSKGWKYSYLDGSTKDREKEVANFQQNAEIPLFLISLKAGGIGLNLTAADYVLLYDPWWNDAVEDQAISRAHRIGRKNVVIAKRYVAVESIEEKIMKLKDAKRSLIEDMLDNDLGNSNLTMEDFKFLLS